MSKGITNLMEMEEPFYVRRKPDPIPFSKFLFNSEKRTVLGRTGTSWGKFMETKIKFLSQDIFNTNTIVMASPLVRLHRCG